VIVEPRLRAAGGRSAEVLFVGGFGHHPNVDGLSWFVSQVWPIVRRAVPQAGLSVIGSDPPAEIQGLHGVAGVRVLGHVPSVEPYLDRAAVSVAPIRYGAGMKGKVVEAMASGVPVVTTATGAQGLYSGASECLSIADEPLEFARAVIRLLQDPVRCEVVGLAGQRRVATLCSSEVAGRELDRMIARVVPHRRPLGARFRWWPRSLGGRREAAFQCYLDGRRWMWRGDCERARGLFWLALTVNPLSTRCWFFFVVAALPRDLVRVLRDVRRRAEAGRAASRGVR